MEQAAVVIDQSPVVWSSRSLDRFMPQQPSDPAAFDMRDTLRRWLEAYPFAVQEVPASAEMAWLLRATGNAGEYGVGVLGDQPDRVVISAFIDVPPEVSPRIQESVLTDLRIGLLAFDVDASGLARPLRRVVFSTRMYWSGANQEQFIRSLHRVRNALLFLQAFIAREAPEHGEPISTN